MKTIREIQNETGLSDEKFSKLVGMSRRTYIGRFDGSQPKWLLTDIIEIANQNKGNVRVSVNDKTYDISVKEITE